MVKISEFDIRIGTQLNTEKAEAELKAFIDKYNEKNISINLDVKGMEKLTALETSLKNIANLAKNVGAIKINVGSTVGSVNSEIGSEIGKNIETLIGATNNVQTQLTEGTKKAIGTTAKGLEKEIARIESKIGTMVSNLESLKLNPFSDTKAIDGMLTTLKQLKSTDLRIEGTNLEATKQQIDSVANSYKQLASSANNLKLQDSFNNLKVDSILKEMQSVKEVLSAKGLDTGWIDSLIGKMTNLKSSTADLKTIKSSFADLKGSFSNLKATMDVSSIKSAETAIKALLSYKNELNKKIAISTDTSEVQKLQSSVEKVDATINKLKSNLSSSSMGAIGNLIESSDIQNVENLKKQYDNLVTSLEKYKAKASSIKSGDAEFIDISKLRAVDDYIKKIETDLNSLNVGKLNATDLNNVTNDFKVLDNAIKQVESSSKNLKLEAKFDVNFSNVEQQLNGLHSALIKAGQDTSSIKQLKTQLDSIKNLAKVDLSSATNQLKNFASNLGKGLNLGNIKGEISQYISYLKQLQSAQQQLGSAKSINIASGLEAEIGRIKSALSQLESGFSSAQKKIASGFKESFSGNNFSSELNKMVASVQKLQTVANSMGNSSIFSHLTSEGGKLSAEFDKLQSKITELGSKLQTALKTGDIDASGMQKLQQEIMETLQYSEKLSKLVVNVDCSEAISQLDRLEAEMQQAGKDTSALNALKMNYKTISDQVNNGTKSFANASKEINNANKQATNFNATTTTTSKSIGAIGTGIQGAFSQIKQSFANFGLGMIISQGVMTAVGSIKEAITGLDEAKTELARVLPDNVSATSDNLTSIANQAREIGISVGQSTEDVIVGMSSALQAGANNMQQASEIAKSSAIFQNVTDMSASEASEAVASLINQYYSMDTALSQVSTGMGKSVEGYNNLTEAMDMVNDLPFMLEIA